MIVYPNQKIVRENKAPANRENIYAIVNKAALYEAISGLSHNELKAYLYITANQNGYLFALSTEDMANKMGGNPEGMRKGIKGLIRKGFLVSKKKNEYEFLEKRPTQIAAEDGSEEKKDSQELQNNVETVRCCSDHHDKKEGEIIYGEYSENTRDYKEDNLKKPFSDEWYSLFRKIHVNLFPHTMVALQRAAGEEPDIVVVCRIVEENWYAFEKGMSQEQGYRLNTLLNLMSAHYHEVKREMQESLPHPAYVNHEPYLYEGWDTSHRKRRRSLDEIMEQLESNSDNRDDFA